MIYASTLNDRIEMGSGPITVLTYANVSGARQSRRLMAGPEGRFPVIAIIPCGHESSPAWTERGTQTIGDRAALLETAFQIMLIKSVCRTRVGTSGAMTPRAGRGTGVNRFFLGSILLNFANRMASRKHFRKAAFM